jgi:hypothetical protein
MLTRKLTQANKETGKLVDFLIKRDWDNSHELATILENAEKEIERIQDKAISDVLVKLQGSYTEESLCWAENKMTNSMGNPVKITVAEQRKAKTEFNRIQKTIGNLYDII